jgi:hypothetical protein
MAARLWPHAWELLAVFVIAAFGLLEDAGFRRGLHLTLSRQTARIPHVVLIIAVAGPIGCWIYAVHVARIQADRSAGATMEVPSCPHS